MENEMFNGSIPLADHSHMVLDAVPPHMFSGPFFQSGINDHNNYRHIMPTESLFSTLQEESTNNLFVANHGITVSDGIQVSGNISFSSSIGNTNQGDHLMGTSLSAASHANILSSSTSLQDNLNSVNIASHSAVPPVNVRTSIPSDSCRALNTLLTASVNYEFGQQDDIDFLANKKNTNLNELLNYRCNYDELNGYQMPSTRRISTVRPSYRVIGSSEPGWNSDKSSLKLDQPYGFCGASNELSLSLGSCQPPIISMPNVPDNCSEVSCSSLTQVTSKDNGYPPSNDMQDYSHVFQNSFHSARLGKGQSVANGEELSLHCGSSNEPHFAQVILGSRYLHVAQEILAGIANYALEELDNMDDPMGVIESEAKTAFSFRCCSMQGFPLLCSDDFLCSEESKSHSPIDPSQQKEESNSKKSELLTMLQMVDTRYSQWLDQTQNIISAYESATAAGTPPMHARFALYTMSVLYKNMREKIASHIILIIQQSSGEHMKGKDRTFDSSFIRKQWALQQLRRTEQQSWRPQRGLPDKSVAVLRAWMFHNFLHPYPKDNEKQMLAIQSGLTRGQVSNWFINARVRLWKPLIEEMYSEINKKNQAEEGSGGEGRSYGNTGSRIIHMK